MTKTEAAGVLGVAEAIGLQELRKQYEMLHTDYQIRLTNAPTPTLKKTYQQKLQELLAAADVLHPGFSTNTSGGDLPSAEPLFVDVPMPVRRQTASHVAAPSRRGTAEGNSDAIASSGLPHSTMIAGVVAVVLAAALSFVALKWVQASARVDALQADGEKLLTAARSLQAKVDAADKLAYADRLRVRNGSSKSVKILAVALIYRDPSGALKLAHSGNFDYPTWEIRPGATVQLDADMRRGRGWDGPVLYYALLLDYPGVDPFLKSGIWSEDIDIDKNVTLELD